ncbi:3-oxoadipate enol-lactonase [Microbacterium hydrothermale]|uniref:alpha/beta hydrolase n=1 Tax=Microbacterium hydrothermale TaxID=857427 RepID=UPI0022278E06|nr:alpha/beta hydrolase [Microbacterium hydrothermale]MCW2163135.1 3-oxoadipate enol-lactonase [Microbacterium hydrothermale]
MSAAPLVLLAGMNCTDDLWTGCGLDDALTPALDADDLDVQVDRLLRRLPARFVIGGLSLGAIVAMALAVRAPDRVVGLCVTAANAKAPTARQYEGWTAWLARLAAGETPAELQAGILPVLLSASAFESRPDLVGRTIRMGEETPARALAAQLRLQASRVDLRPRLRALSLPTLVIAGVDDALCPPRFHEEIAASLTGAHLENLAAGHLVPLERPTEFGEVVRAWRTRTDSAS